jgi:hypothetical protein
MEWPAQLNHMLQDYKHCEVINASVVGLGVEYFIPYLRKYVLHLQPDTVILYVNPYFYIGSKLEESNIGGNNGPSEKNTGEVAGNPKTKISACLKLRSLSKIKQAVYQHIPQHLSKPLQIWANSRQVRELEERSLAGKNPLDVVPDEYLASFELNMTQLIDFLKRHQAKVILSTYPSLITGENLKDHLEVFLEFRRFCIGLSFKGMLDAHKRFNDALRRVAEKTGAGLVDNSRIVPSDVQYFRDNVHYTNKGATLVARSFADFILSDMPMVSGFKINLVREQ